MSKFLSKLLALTVMVVGLTFGLSSVASAHANLVTGTSACQADGTYTVTWKIGNDYNSPDTVTYVSKVGGGTITGLPATIAASPNQPYKSATVVQSGVPGTTKTAGLTIKGTWADNYSQNDSGSVTLAGNCVTTTTTTPPTTVPPTTTTPPTTVPPTTVPPTTVPPTTSTTVPSTEPPTSTTVPETTTTVPETTTPVTEPPTTLPETTVPETTTVENGTAPVPPTTAPFVPVAPEVLAVTELPSTGINLWAIALFAALLIVLGGILMLTNSKTADVDSDDDTYTY